MLRLKGYRAARLGIAVMFIAGTVVLVQTPSAPAAPTAKTVICHRTDSVTNPYVTIEVSNNSLATHLAHGDVVAPAGGCGDKCPNIPGHQVLVPTGLYVNAAGDCVPIDVCPNLPGVQTSVPAGFFINAAGDCVPIPQPCNASTLSGGPGTTVTTHELGQAGPLSFQFDYQTYTVPDAITIKYEGTEVFSTGGPVSTGPTTVTVTLPAGTSTQVEVTVVGPSGTVWDYTVNCPAP